MTKITLVHASVLPSDATGDGKTSVRGGYGIYYGRINGTIIINSLINTGLSTGQAVSSVPANCSAALCGGAANANNPTGNPAAPIFPNILATAPAGTAGINYFRDGFQNPLIHQGDLILEREVARNTVVSASYLFSFGNHLTTFVDTNLNPPTAQGRVNIVDGPFAGQVWVFPFYRGARPRDQTPLSVTSSRFATASRRNTTRWCCRRIDV